MFWTEIDTNVYRPDAAGLPWVFTTGVCGPEAFFGKYDVAYPAERYEPRLYGEGWTVARVNDGIAPGIDGWWAYNGGDCWAGYAADPLTAIAALKRFRKQLPSYRRTGKAPWHLRLLTRLLYGRPVSRKQA